MSIQSAHCKSWPWDSRAGILLAAAHVAYEQLNGNATLVTYAPCDTSSLCLITVFMASMDTKTDSRTH